MNTKRKQTVKFVLRQFVSSKNDGFDEEYQKLTFDQSMTKGKVNETQKNQKVSNQNNVGY